MTSTLQNPIHIYTGVGAYTVRLTANTERHSDTETKAGYVTVVPTSAIVITYTYCIAHHEVRQNGLEIN